MTRTLARTTTLLATAVMIGLAGSCARPMAPPPEVPGDGKPGKTVTPNFRWVYLEYDPDGGSEDCIVVTPEDAFIFEPPKKPHKIMWKVRDKNDDHEWVIERSGTKTNPPEDRFPGQKKIPCRSGLDSFNSGPPKAAKPGSEDWYYDVVVYRCEDRGERVELCRKDPRVHIRE